MQAAGHSCAAERVAESHLGRGLRDLFRHDLRAAEAAGTTGHTEQGSRSARRSELRGQGPAAAARSCRPWVASGCVVVWMVRSESELDDFQLFLRREVDAGRNAQVLERQERQSVPSLEIGKWQLTREQ